MASEFVDRLKNKPIIDRGKTFATAERLEKYFKSDSFKKFKEDLGELVSDILWHDDIGQPAMFVTTLSIASAIAYLYVFELPKLSTQEQGDEGSRRSRVIIEKDEPSALLDVEAKDIIKAIEKMPEEDLDKIKDFFSEFMNQIQEEKSESRSR